MKIKNVLKLLRKADENTLSEIQDIYSADWEMDELFDKSYEKYLSECNITEDAEKSITVEYDAEKRVSSVNFIVQRIIPAAACFAFIAVSAKILSTNSSNNKTENPDVYNVINTTAEKITEGGVTSNFADTPDITDSDKRITMIYTITEYADLSEELSESTYKNPDSVTASEKNDSDIKTENSRKSENYQDTVIQTYKSVPETTAVLSMTADNTENKTETIPVTSIPDKPLTYETTVSMTIQSSEKRKISVEDILRLSHKGADLDWSDFNEYEYTDVGSGIFVYEYKLKESQCKDYVLRIGGIPEKKPYYIRLMPVEYDSNKYFDITFASEKQIKEYLKYFPEQSDLTEDGENSPYELAEKDLESYVQKYKYESAELDIDKDGITEQCIITYAPAAGFTTHIISAYAEGILKYRNTFDLDTSKLSFAVIDGIPYVRMETEKNFQKYTEDHKIYTVGKKIVIEYKDSVYEWYWGGDKYNLEME